MAEITISEGQSLLDAALWLLGGVEGVFALADANGLDITADLVAGQVLVVPDGFPVSADVVSYYQAGNIRVNTANRVKPVDPAESDLRDWKDEDFINTDYK